MAKQVTKSELIQILATTTETEITVTTRGEAKLNKTNNPFYEKQGRAWVAKDLVEKIAVLKNGMKNIYRKVAIIIQAVVTAM